VCISPHCWEVAIGLNLMKFGVRGQVTNIIVCQILSQSGFGDMEFLHPKIAISHWLASSPWQHCTHYLVTLW